MIAGFFIGLAVWSALYVYGLRVQTAFEETDYGAAAASLVVIVGNAAGVGYLIERLAG